MELFQALSNQLLEIKVTENRNSFAVKMKINQ